MDSHQLMEVLSQFNFWRHTPFTGFERSGYLDELAALTATEQVVLVTGARRTGKTTLLLQHLQRRIAGGETSASQTMYVNLEDPRLPVDDGPELLESLLAAHRAHVDSEGVACLVLDEVQRLEGWERWVRVQQQTRPGLTLLISGSSARLLSRELATLLTGRHLDLEVFPLSLAEYCAFHELDPHDPLADTERVRALTLAFLRNSAFPQVVLLEPGNMRERMVQQIYRDLLHHDVARRHNLREVDKLEALANQLLASVPGPVTFNGLRRALGGRLSLDTVERYCSFLHEPYLFHFVPTHAFSSAARRRRPRKVYAVDNGLLLACSHRFSADTGKLLENQVFIDLRRQGHQLFRWTGQREVDFLVWRGTDPLALFNVAAGPDGPATRSREVAGLQEAMAALGLSQAWLITLEHEEHITVPEGEIQVVPYRRWALQRDYAVEP